ncbi:hypothetical protein [Flexithrix dorotheae]|uniref:hypothetical protein n=1 Tax=Flexithrix dorotheae TaxID=70993 RepID=UPI0003783D90|nr:hypothetical protein [Flexithrix dorotheae]
MAETKAQLNARAQAIKDAQLPESITKVMVGDALLKIIEAVFNYGLSTQIFVAAGGESFINIPFAKYGDLSIVRNGAVLVKDEDYAIDIQNNRVVFSANLDPEEKVIFIALIQITS